MHISHQISEHGILSLTHIYCFLLICIYLLWYALHSSSVISQSDVFRCTAISIIDTKRTLMVGSTRSMAAHCRGVRLLASSRITCSWWNNSEVKCSWQNNNTSHIQTLWIIRCPFRIIANDISSTTALNIENLQQHQLQSFKLLSVWQMWHCGLTLALKKIYFNHGERLFCELYLDFSWSCELITIYTFWQCHISQAFASWMKLH